MQLGLIMISGMVCLAVSTAMSIMTSAPDHPGRRPFDQYSFALPPGERRNRQTPMLQWSMLTPHSNNDQSIEAAISVPRTTSNTAETWSSAESKLIDRKENVNKEKLPKALFNRLQPLNLEESLGDAEEDEGPSSVEIYRLNLVENTPFISSINMYIPTDRNKVKTPKKGSHFDLKHELSKARNEEQMRENSFLVGKVPELQVGCEGFADFWRNVPNRVEARAKRFISDSMQTSTNDSNYTVRIISQEDDDYEYDYEEMDELVRLKKLFGSTQGPRRGDIQIKIDSYTSLVPEEPPKRGDLGKSSVAGTRILIPIKSSEAPISQTESKSGRKMTSDSLSSNVESFVKNSDSSEEVFPKEMRSNMYRRSLDRSEGSVLWGFGNDDGEISNGGFENKRKREEHKRRKLLNYAEGRQPDTRAAKVKVQSHRQLEKRNDPPYTNMPYQTRLNENSANQMKSDRYGQRGIETEWESELKIKRKLLEYVNRNRPVILDGPENRPQKVNETKSEMERWDGNGRWSTDGTGVTEESDAWRGEQARRRRLQEERKLQDYVRRNQPVSVPRQMNSGVSNELNVIDKRRETGAIRYPAIHSDEKKHGPSAPTIDFYPRYDPRYELSRTRTAQETKNEEEEKRRSLEGERYVTEERRREEEYRRQQSRSYEENRRRQVAERPEEERRRRPSESGISSENLNEIKKRITNGWGLREDQARRNSDFERHTGGEKRLTERKRQQDRLNPRNHPMTTVGRDASHSWRQREDARLNALPVSARIILQPPTRRGKISSATVTSRINGGFGNDINFPGINPNQRGAEAAGFPVPATSRPPITSPSPCVWAIVQCCPSRRGRLVTCFESLGCLGANWTPNPCNGAIAQAAQMEITKFYADVDASDHH